MPVSNGNRHMKRFLLLVAFAGAASAQEFAVASVKVSAAPVPGIEARGGARTEVSPGALRLHNHNLHGLLMWAYSVKEYQVAGPDWINSEKYDIEGKPGSPASRQEMAAMLQRLLAARFQLSIRREKREMGVYGLVTAKGGPKLSTAAAGCQPSRTRLPGGLRLGFQCEPMEGLADFLSSLLAVGRPVIDATSLSGAYDFTLDLTDAAPPEHPGSDPEGRPSVSTVLQEQLGLRLEGRRAPVDVLVVEAGNRTPREN